MRALLVEDDTTIGESLRETLRRRHDGRTSTVLQVADLTLDPATRVVVRGGLSVELRGPAVALSP